MSRANTIESSFFSRYAGECRSSIHQEKGDIEKRLLVLYGIAILLPYRNAYKFPGRGRNLAARGKLILSNSSASFGFKLIIIQPDINILVLLRANGLEMLSHYKLPLLSNVFTQPWPSKHVKSSHNIGTKQAIRQRAQRHMYLIKCQRLNCYYGM
jgi:hypothetical protein